MNPENITENQINALDSDSDNDGLADYMENTGYSIQIIKYKDTNMQGTEDINFLTKEDRSAYTIDVKVNTKAWISDTDGNNQFHLKFPLPYLLLSSNHFRK